MMHVPNQYRLYTEYRPHTDYTAIASAAGNNGSFLVPTRPGKPPMRVIASDGDGWEHVSVSLPNRCPTWDEMCKIKALFWDDEDCVIQFHPPKSEYVNLHPYCLHLWRPVGVTISLPDRAPV